MKRSHFSVTGFTLVELLTVMVLLSMMGAMVVTAVRGVNRTARAARTRSIIAAIDSVIQEQYESYKYRPLPITMPNFSRTVTATPPATGTITFNYEVLAYEAARVRLIMTRDLQRMELPDKQLDVVIASSSPPPAFTIQGPMTIHAVANRVVEAPNPPFPPGRVLRKFDARDEFTVPWTPASKINLYFDRVEASGSTWTAQHEGAECLYMIMATSFSSGSPALSVIPSSNIADTDNDGMPEILDGWGNPLGFVRWPVGYTDPTGTLDTSVPDDFDLFRSDFGYNVSGVTQPWSIRPLIVSAGSDGQFGIALSGTTDHRLQEWPLNEMDTGTATLVGNDNQDRTDPYPYPDPYLRQASVSVYPGEQTDSEASTDNITNFGLKVTQ